ncbi:MAG: nucleoside:proton symporter [Desulfobacteraceae bacterium]|nr:nucleoside:proton symporter [Desulfobacteraceae bacterium]MBC2754582.1 nucleoside:proton symporter [Desulfobacteraceae bacterium]
MNVQSAFGFVMFVLIAWCFSENKRRFPVRIVMVGMIIQLLLGVCFLKFPFVTHGFIYLNRAVIAIQESTSAGTSFVFGFIGGGDAPYDVKFPHATFILAFQALPLVLVISALSAVLFYWGILPKIVKGFSRVLEKSMKLGGAEGLGVSANIFVGMVEAPLLIRPYVKQMTKSELFTLMTSGMATIAGTVMVLYASILESVIPNVIGHILTASIISVPAAIVVSKIMIPETGKPTSGELTAAESSTSTVDAITRGTTQGLELLLNIIAMIIVLVALVHLVNLMMALFPYINNEPITLQRIFGWAMSPVVWLMGVSWQEAHTAGSLMGTKTILNEFIAYLDMRHLPEGSLSPKSLLIMSYALCGFANPGSLGIMIGGLGGIAPERRDDIVRLGVRSVIAGTIATCMTGAVVGILNP